MRPNPAWRGDLVFLPDVSRECSGTTPGRVTPAPNSSAITQCWAMHSARSCIPRPTVCKLSSARALPITAGSRRMKIAELTGTWIEEV